jgi:hypothetical protein
MEIFLKHQPIHSKKILRAMFDKLAHASIMKLNTESMDRVSTVYFIHVNILNCRTTINRILTNNLFSAVRPNGNGN